MTTTVCSNELPASQALPQAAETITTEKHRYAQILKSSALIGGSSLLNIGIRILRTKAMALLLGPSGFGLAGLYGAVSDLTQSVAGMGINSSGVRQIAEAVGSRDGQRIAKTTAVLRKTSLAVGALGAVLLVFFSKQVSTLTFGNSNHSGGVSLLAVAVFFGLVSGGQGALILGMRRISDFAKMGVVGALSGSAVSIVLVYFLRKKGVVPSLVGISVMTALASYYYSHKVDIRAPALTLTEVRREAAALLKLGFAFMISAMMMMGVAYIVRVIILRKVGFEATGLYQSAWTLGGLYVGFILQAMGADFYPRLTASAKDDPACNRMVNEQTQVGLLLAGPGVIATLTFAPMVIFVFYSTKFGAAVGILRWVCLGGTLQVITWPMGYIIVAKGKADVFLYAELAWAAVAVGLAWTCVRAFGLNGAGIAFFASYIFHALMIYPIVRWLSGFRWSGANQQTALLFLSLIAVVFCGFFMLPMPWASCIGALGMVLSGVYSVRSLSKLICPDQIPRPIRRLVLRFGAIDSP